MIDNIKHTLWKIKNAETFSGREITTKDYVRDVTFLLDLVHKSQGMANEINILTAEIKELASIQRNTNPTDALIDLLIWVRGKEKKDGNLV